MRMITAQSRVALKAASRIYLIPFLVMLASYLALTAVSTRVLPIGGGFHLTGGFYIANGAIMFALPFLFLYLLHRQGSKHRCYLDLSLPVPRTRSSIYVALWFVMFALIFTAAYFTFTLFVNEMKYGEYVSTFPFFRMISWLFILIGAASFGRGMATSVNRLKLFVGISVVIIVYLVHYSVQNAVLPMLLPESIIEIAQTPIYDMHMDYINSLIRIDALDIIQTARSLINLTAGLALLVVGIALESRREV